MTTPQTSSAPEIPGRRSPLDPTGSSPGAVPHPGAPPPRGGLARRVERFAVRRLSAYSVAALRISLGLVFLGFGALKFVPGLSPAAGLATRTVETLTLGLVPGGAALLLTAGMECAVGLALVTGRLLRTGLAVLGVSLVGILSPLVLFTADLFPGAPTLEAQYVLKDVVLVTAAMVVAATALGARLVPPGEPHGDERPGPRGAHHGDRRRTAPVWN